MKLTPEQLGDWFYTANREWFGEGAYAMWLGHLKAPPDGITRSQLVSGMKEGINDTLAMAEGWNYKKWKEVSDALAAKGLPSIEKMELRMKQKHRRILKRGSIRNDEEFYLVAEILSDLTLDVSDEDRAALDAMSAAYETTKKD